MLLGGRPCTMIPRVQHHHMPAVCGQAEFPAAHQVAGDIRQRRLFARGEHGGPRQDRGGPGRGMRGRAARGQHGSQRGGRRVSGLHMTPAACRQAPGGQVQDCARKRQAHRAEHGQILQRVVVTAAPCRAARIAENPRDWIGRGETARGSLRPSGGGDGEPNREDLYSKVKGDNTPQPERSKGP